MSQELEEKKKSEEQLDKKPEKKKKEKKEKTNLAYFMRKRMLTVLVVIFIFLYSGYNMVTQFDVFKENVETSVDNIWDKKSDMKTEIAVLDASMTSDMKERMKFVEIFSYVQKVLGKREINNFKFVKDETGSLHYSSFYKDISVNNYFEYALRVKRLSDYAKEQGTDVLFVVAPSKFVTDDNRLKTGLPVNDPQAIVDETLFYLNRLGVDTLDLNQYIPNEKVTYEDSFFRTDHHWTIPAAFNATKILANTLNEEYGYGLDVDYYLADENFETVQYKQGMLGSMGRATGVNYSGLDDFTAIYPLYHADINRKCLEENGSYSEYKGDLIGTVIRPDQLTGGSLYERTQYGLYLDGLRPYEQVINYSNPDGKKIFMIRDSYFSPVISFMTPMCNEIDAMWSLEESDEINIEEYIRANKFDCIIVEIYPYNINEDAFQYFMEE